MKPTLDDIFNNPQVSGKPSLDQIFNAPLSQISNPATNEASQTSYSLNTASAPNHLADRTYDPNGIGPSFIKNLGATYGQIGQNFMNIPGETRSIIDKGADQGSVGKNIIGGIAGIANAGAHATLKTIGNTIGAVYAPIGAAAQAVIPNKGIGGDIARGAATGAALGGPVGALIGGAFGTLPTLMSKIQNIPEIKSFLDTHPYLAEDINNGMITVLALGAQAAADKNAPKGQPDIFHANIQDVPGRVGTNLLNTAAVPLKVVAPVAKPIIKYIADRLEKTNLRLTPVQKARLGDKINDVVQFDEKNNITGNPEERLNKVNSILDQRNKEVKSFLTTGEAKDTIVPKDQLLNDLNELKKSYANGNEYDSTGAIAKIDKAINRVEQYKTDQIPTADIWELKSSAYKSAYDPVGKVRDPILTRVSHVFKNSVEKATDGMTINGQSVSDYNKEFGTAITAQTLIETAVGRNELGLIGKLTAKGVGTALGTAIGGPVGGVAGFSIGDEIAKILVGTSARSHISSLLSKVAGLGSGSSSGDMGLINSYNELSPKQKQGGYLMNGDIFGKDPEIAFSTGGSDIFDPTETITIGGKSFTLDQLHKNISKSDPSIISGLGKNITLAEQAKIATFDKLQSLKLALSNAIKDGRSQEDISLLKDALNKATK